MIFNICTVMPMSKKYKKFARKKHFASLLTIKVKRDSPW